MSVIIKSKLHRFIPKPLINQIKIASFSTINKKIPENFSDSDQEIDEIQNPIVNKLYSIITDHHKKNPNFHKKPNPNFTISSVFLSFSQVIAGESISPSVVASVIKKTRSFRHGIPFTQAVSFFNWVILHANNVESFIDSYVEIIDLAGKCKEFYVVWSFIEDMKNRKLDIPVDVFVSLIRRYTRAGMVGEAMHTFNRMEEYGCKADNSVFTAIITSLVRKKFTVQAQAFFDEFKDRFKPDVVDYTSIVNGWCRIGRISEAEKVFNEMKLIGVEPNVYTYSTIIDGLCRQRMIMRANDVLFEMIENGCQPNTVTFNNLIRVHVKAKKIDKALEVYNQMKRRGCEPDVITYNFLIDCYCSDANRVEAMKLLHQMVKKGVLPNAQTFNRIFDCIALVRDVNAAHRLFAKMKELGCKPNTVTYNVLMWMFVESKSTDMVFKLRKEMDELEVEPNVNTYRLFIRMFCDMGHWSNAFKYFREMVVEKNIRPTQPMYEMVLRQLKLVGQISKHEEVVGMMVERGFAFPSTKSP